MKLTLEQEIHYALRIAAAMCFIGHGSFGIITKEIWCNYFGVFGIGKNTSFHLMPIVGSIDVLMGIIILFYPVRSILLWLVIWGTITALLRPLSGEPLPEFMERVGNFGAPLALLLFSGGTGTVFKNLFKPVTSTVKPDEKKLELAKTCLRFVVCFLFIGHGWLNLIEKKSLLDQYRILGFSDPATTAQCIGLFEIVAGLSVLIRPIRLIVIILCIWKIASELFYPHYEVFEWVERGGSYGSILALWFALGLTSSYRNGAAVTKGSTYLTTN